MEEHMREHTSRIIKALGFTVVASSLVACGGEPVDNEATQEALTTNTQALSQRVVDSYAFLDESEMFSSAADGVFGQGDVACSGTSGPDGEWIETCEEPAPVELDAEIEQGTEEMLRYLNEYVFVEGNIEQSKRKEVTYLLRGENVCKDLQGEAEGYSECVSTVDDLELRLVVTSPQEGDVSIDVLVGPDRFNPVSFDVWQDRLAVEAGLGDIKNAAKFVAKKIGGEDVSEELPDVIKGRVRFELRAEGPKQLAVEASVLQAVEISDVAEGYDIRLAEASPAVSVLADAATEELTYTVNWGAIDAKFPMVQDVYDDAPEPIFDGGEGDFGGEGFGEPSEERHVVDLHLAGATGQVLFKASQEVLELRGVGFGAGESTLDLDGERVFAMELNPEDGHTFDMTLREQGEGVEVAFAPGLDLSMLFKFGRVADQFSDLDVEDWMLDEELSVLFTGDAPALLLGEDQVEVTGGTLTLSSTSRAITHTASANQCLLDAGHGDVALCAPAEPGQPEPVCEGGEGEYDSHPLANLEVGACE